MWREIFENPEVAVALAFVIAIGLVAKRAWATISGMLDKRSADIKSKIDEAQRLRDDAQQTLAQYQRKQRDALQEAEAILTHAKEEAARMAEQAKRDLEAAIERRQRLAVEKIALAEGKAIAEVRATAVDIAIDATSRILTERLAGERGNALVDQAIAELPLRLN